jgi:transcriptional regulator with XRE-family HTH domain
MITSQSHTSICDIADAVPRKAGPGQMDQHESPAVARRRLRMALRELRDEAGMTQRQVADELAWSLSKVNRIELGEVAISKTDLQALLRLLKIGDTSRGAELHRHWDATRVRSWWDDPRYRTNVTAATIELLQFEGDASAIYAFHPTVVPGIVQAYDYTKAVLALWPDLPADERTARLDFRMKLRDHVLERPDPPRVVLIIDESVLSREVGGPQVMIEQLQALVAYGRQERVAIHVLPLAPFAVLSLEAPFVLLEMGDNDTVLYRESTLTDEMLDNREVVDRYHGIVKEMLAKSLSVEASMRLIEAKAAMLAYELARM